MKRTGSGLPGSKAYLATASKIVSAASDAFCGLTGYSVGDLLGRDIGDVLKTLRVHQDACDRLDSSGEAAGYLFTKTFDPREVTISLLPGQDLYDAVYLFAEKPNSRLEDKTIFVNHLFLQNNIGVAIYSVPELILLKANARYLEDSKVPFKEADQYVGLSLPDLVPGYAESPTAASWSAVLNSKKPCRISEYRAETSQGVTYWDVAQIPVFDGGTMKYVFKTHENVTDRVLSKVKLQEQEKALRERDIHLRLAAAGASLGTFTHNNVTGENFWSDELKLLWGLQPDTPVELNDKNHYYWIHPDDLAELDRRFYEAGNPLGDGLVDMDHRVILPDGSIRWLHLKAQTTFGEMLGTRRALFTAGIVIDITDRVVAETSVREKSEELHHIIESTDDFIFSVDPDYRLIFCNSSFRNFVLSRFGRQVEKGTSMPEVFSPREPTIWLNTLAETKRGEKMQFEIKIDNDNRVMSFSLNPVFFDGQLVEITIFGKDITARINSEREIIRLNSTLEQRVLERTNALQQSVKSMQDISRIFSHDLKAPIREIIRCAGELEQTSDALPYTRKIKRTCASITQMIDDLSTYVLTSDKELRSEQVNLKKTVMSVYNELKTTYQNDSVLYFETGLPLVRTDQVLMRHVLSNLLSNALKFSSKKELAEITVGCREENDSYIFYVKDNGVGFDMHYVQKLFTVFERLHSKREFEGNGIGLAAVRSIIQRLGGRTWIESIQGIGTTVYFTLPVAPEV